MEPVKNIDTILAKLKSQGAMTSGTLAKALNMTSMGARQHLLRLERKKLVSHFLERANIGRPKQMWQLTELGHQRFPDRHADLTLQLLDSVNTVFGEQGLAQLITVREQQILKRYQEALKHCKTLASKVSTLALIRSDEGYIARVEKVSDQHYVLIENHCPICAAASQCQSFCRSELAIFQQCLGDNYKVQHGEYLLAGDRRCSYKITVNDCILA
ncbi:helix-turn-helix transcriptional regulator [Cognaticolwellia aestuarii]|uniref:helix-turn-helix transcriptional regulator n=1 Tax=Cognaticolwellia aestuarii TaxID=329993 RepID=UPI0009852D6F|nr:metalloregulator ArsR/SmtB family transcription factor [Cognaticolwellia aestuarii]